MKSSYSLLLVLAFSSTAAFSSENSVIILQAGGKVLQRNDHQSLQSNCSADRTWFEVEGLPSDTANEKINAWIRKTVSYGRKLKAKDCPSVASQEKYDYVNTAEFIGQRAAVIGVRTGIHFPGGTGRHHMDCVGLSTKDATVIRFGTYLTDAGRAFLKSEYCNGIGPDEIKSGADKRYYCELGKANAVKDSLYCLGDDGIDVSAPFNGNWRIVEAHVKISYGDTAKYFEFPTEVKMLLGP